jgi:hypothetical protein
MTLHSFGRGIGLLTLVLCLSQLAGAQSTGVHLQPHHVLYVCIMWPHQLLHQPNVQLYHWLKSVERFLEDLSSSRDTNLDCKACPFLVVNQTLTFPKTVKGQVMDS